ANEAPCGGEGRGVWEDRERARTCQHPRQYALVIAQFGLEATLRQRVAKGLTMSRYGRYRCLPVKHAVSHPLWLTLAAIRTILSPRWALAPTITSLIHHHSMRTGAPVCKDWIAASAM